MEGRSQPRLPYRQLLRVTSDARNTIPPSSKKRQGRPPAVCVILKSLLDLLLVHRFLQFGARAEFRDLAGGDFDGGSGLRIAPVARFSLRHGERAEAYQRYPISFAESGRNAVDGGINGSRGLRFADFTCACDLVNQIGFIHTLSPQASFVPSQNRDENDRG